MALFNLLLLVIVGLFVYFTIVPYIDHKIEVFHADVAVIHGDAVAIKTSIENSVTNLITEIKNFHVFGAKNPVILK